VDAAVQAEAAERIVEMRRIAGEHDAAGTPVLRDALVHAVDALVRDVVAARLRLRYGLNQAANAIALPARGLVVDAGLWVGAFAVAFRLPFSLMYSGLIPYYLGLTIMLLVLVPPVAALGMVADALPEVERATVDRNSGVRSKVVITIHPPLESKVFWQANGFH